jgi:hypothetical protein
MVRFLALALSLAAVRADIPLVLFDGSKHQHVWTVENDPVMGGRSESTWSLSRGKNGTTVGEWSGVTRIVPSLSAPGFAFAMTKDPLLTSFPDASGEDGLKLNMRNVAGNVSTFMVAFCDSKIDFYRCQFGSFKANFSLAPSPDMQEIFVPWSSFSDKWSAATGAHTSEDPPKAKSLASITQVQLWVEGVAGTFHVWLQSIYAGKAS